MTANSTTHIPEQSLPQTPNLHGRPARTATVERNTAETQVKCTVNLDGTGQGVVDTGVPFLDHMIDQIKRHGLFDLDIKCTGDTYIDDHHSVEDTGITLGQAFAKALGDKKGIRRYGHFYAPLDESLTRAVVDISGRPGPVSYTHLTLPTICSV